ncbi:MAG: nickel-dependent hydrogenase large subunit [Desulfurococcaceae archaeon]
MLGGSLVPRIEGEGRVYVYVKNGRVERVEFAVVEAQRYFERLLRGRRVDEVPDVVSRICGFCGVSHALNAAIALEKCLGIAVDEAVEEFRRVLHLAERVKSHVLHAFFLNLPDYVGGKSLFDLKAVNPGFVEAAMKLAASSLKALEALGGRSHNVVGIRVGGAYLPSIEEAAKALKHVEESIKLAGQLAEVVLSLKTIPSEGLLKPTLFLEPRGEYPHVGERLVLLRPAGAEVFGSEEFEQRAEGFREPGKNAAVYRIGGESCITGPIARFNAAYGFLREETRELLELFGWRPPLRDVRQSIVARIAEIYDALLVLRDFLAEYKKPAQAGVYAAATASPRSRSACTSVVEAPRGVLYHKYVVNEELRVVEAKIVTPTQINIAGVEEIAREALSGAGPLSEGDLRRAAEALVRSVDPCLSCSVHVVKL